MGYFYKISKMKENGSNILKFREHSETDPKVQKVNVKLVLIISYESTYLKQEFIPTTPKPTRKRNIKRFHFPYHSSTIPTLACTSNNGLTSLGKEFDI